ncbi:SurE-like protein [Venustampulla echinocandica]|uniref:SurE-like protein n=1 Tax=Venustampulla echinocandica TaxID=2656787 RepID=A0A370U0H8_9HELO|nr:SurE-like protein [Venustampulla echinocandica]RDL41278.1 SurE-like protein [Venustampulla echinocandica]
MRFSQLTSALVVAAVGSSAVNGLNILISNDDGFGTANIREMYKAVKAYGHTVWIVASVTNQSGAGGTAIYTTERNLTIDSEFGIVKKGQPSVGADPNDSHIWYYNGTPSACVQVALDYVLPRYANFSTPDLVLSGPNYGLNLGPFLYTLAGTLGAAYTAVERSIPAIAFSGGTSVQTAYYHVNTTTSAGLKDTATIYGELAANLAQQLITNVAKKGGGRLLPPGYGINVNMPFITSFTNDSCINPPFIHTRLTGGADVDEAVYNSTTGLFTWGNVVPEGANTCINGDCSLPGETDILNAGCQSSVSVFTVDYDAPLACHASPDLRGDLAPLVQYANSTIKVGGLDGTSSVTNGTAVITAATPTSTLFPVGNVGAGSFRVSRVASGLGMVLVVVADLWL